METTTIRVLLVDDHEVVRAGYRRLLENTPDIKVIAEARDGEEAYLFFTKYKPDVVIMDLSMPGIGGLESIKKIIYRDKTAKVLVFSVHESEIFLNRSLEEGVLGYITKRSAAKVMVEAVRQVAQNKIYVGEEMVRHLVKSKSIAEDNGLPLTGLSSREFEIFLLLAEGKNTVDIGEILSLSPKTVSHHYTSIRNKLGISNASELTRLAIRVGLIEP